MRPCVRFAPCSSRARRQRLDPALCFRYVPFACLRCACGFCVSRAIRVLSMLQLLWPGDVDHWWYCITCAFCLRTCNVPVL
eukprot:3491421-Pleurochrysis_carterae.AAC.1